MDKKIAILLNVRIFQPFRILRYNYGKESRSKANCSLPPLPPLFRKKWMLYFIRLNNGISLRWRRNDGWKTFLQQTALHSMNEKSLKQQPMLRFVYWYIFIAITPLFVFFSVRYWTPPEWQWSNDVIRAPASRRHNNGTSKCRHYDISVSAGQSFRMAETLHRQETYRIFTQVVST